MANIEFFTGPEVKNDQDLTATLQAISQIDGVLSPICVLPDVSHKAERISPTGLVVASESFVFPSVLPAANGSGVRIATLTVEKDALTPSVCASFLKYLRLRVPIYGEDSPELIRGVLRDHELEKIYQEGAQFVNKRYQLEDDRLHLESGGCLPTTDTSIGNLPEFFTEQGRFNFGILESGNHFIELQCIDAIDDHKQAERLGLQVGQVILMIHDGSPASLAAQYYHPNAYAKKADAVRFECDKRAYHQRCGMGEQSAYFAPSAPFYGIAKGTAEYQRFMNLMGAACNFGFANRAYIQMQVTKALDEALNVAATQANTLTDTLHDCVKESQVAGRSLLVHRHGASEAREASTYSAAHPFSQSGQVFGVPGAPGRGSFIVSAHKTEKSFYCANHGAGRAIDRSKARNCFSEEEALASVSEHGVAFVKAGLSRFSGEHPKAYKDVNSVIEVATEHELLKPIARLKPIAIYKG